MACQTDLAGLPLLSGCPASNEWFLVGNAIGGLDADGNYTVGYARRLWSDLQSCAAAAIQFMFQQFTIGQSGSPVSAGASSLTLTFSSLGIKGILQDSVFITLAGPELPRENTDQLSYGVVYNSTNVVINFLQPVTDGQLYILHYAYTS